MKNFVVETESKFTKEHKLRDRYFPFCRITADQTLYLLFGLFNSLTRAGKKKQANILCSVAPLRGRFGCSPRSTLDVCCDAPQQKLLTQRSKNIRRNKERLSSQQGTNPRAKSKLFQFPKHSYVTALMGRWLLSPPCTFVGSECGAKFAERSGRLGGGEELQTEMESRGGKAVNFWNVGQVPGISSDSC